MPCADTHLLSNFISGTPHNGGSLTTSSLKMPSERTTGSRSHSSTCKPGAIDTRSSGSKCHVLDQLHSFARTVQNENGGPFDHT